MKLLGTKLQVLGVLVVGLALVPGVVFGQGVVDTVAVVREVDSLIQISRSLTGKRDYDKALEVSAAAEKLSLEKLGRESAEYGSACFSHGRVLYFKEDFTEAEKWYLKAIAIQEKSLGKEHPNYASSLNNLANLYKDIGNYKKAEPLYLESKAIREKVLGKEHPDYASSLGNLAILYKRMGRYESAESLYIESTAIREKVLGKEHPDYANSLHNLAVLYLTMGNYEKAESLFLEVRAIREKVLGKEHPDYASTLNSLANLYMEMGNYEKAELLFLETKDIREKVLGKEHSEYAGSLNNLAVLNRMMGNYEKAELLHLEAKSIREKVLGKEHPDYTKSLNNLANLYNDMGNYEKAELLHLEAKSIREKVLGKEHPDYASSLNNLANLYGNIGNYEKAELFYLETKAIWGKVNGTIRPEYAGSLYNLASLYKRMGNYEKAEPLILEALSIREIFLGKEHSEYATSLNILANLYWEIGNYEKAEPLYLEVKSTWEKAWGKEHSYYAGSLNNLANLYFKMGNYKKAESIHIEAKSIREKVLGKEHPEYTESLKGLAVLYQSMSKYKKAEPFFNELALLNQSLLTRATHYLSEREMNNYLLTFSDNQSQILSFIQIPANKKSHSTQVCYNNSLFYKGFLLNSLNQIKRLALSDPVTTEKFNLLKSYGRRLATEYTKPIAERKNVAQLEEKANDIEKELTRTAAGYGESRRQVKWEEVQQKLKASEAAVEFVHYQYYDKKLTDSTMYAALLLRPGDKQPLFISLFEEKQLAALFQKTGTEATTIQNTYQTTPSSYGKDERHSRLYDLLWKPLEKHLRGVKKIYYSPSGMLHQVAFPAIAEKPGKLLADRYELEYVGSTRELVTGREALPGDTAHVRTAAVFGGIRYETDTTLLASADHKIECEGCPRGGERSYPNFLPGSLAEMRALDSLFAAWGIACDTFSGYGALEARVKNLSSDTARRSPDVLHLSTHGYFYPDPKAASDKAAYDAPFKWADNPLFRSYLLMAGGLDAHLGRLSLGSYDDGILSAYEIAPLNLSNTKLVVLSACQTGLGDVRGSEGVYGLQRAFKMAGVERLLVTLWQVDDRATAAFMKAFYGHWLSGMDIRAAFRKAQQDVWATVGWEDPYFWAGFVLM